MSRNLRSRLNRLERRPHVNEADVLPLDFWAAISGIVPPEALDPETRRLVERLLNPPARPDPIEQRLAEEEELVRQYEQAQGLAPARGIIPYGLKEIPANGVNGVQP
jgi:hypothetical protein